MDLLVEVNAALWGFILPMLGVFSFVRFKRGGPYGEGGTYISNWTALGLMALAAGFSHFIPSPMIRSVVESICSSGPIMGYVLIAAALVVMWWLISRNRES